MFPQELLVNRHGSQEAGKNKKYFIKINIYSLGNNYSNLLSKKAFIEVYSIEFNSMIA